MAMPPNVAAALVRADLLLRAIRNECDTNEKPKFSPSSSLPKHLLDEIWRVQILVSELRAEEDFPEAFCDAVRRLQMLCMDLGAIALTAKDDEC